MDRWVMSRWVWVGWSTGPAGEDFPSAGAAAYHYVRSLRIIEPANISIGSRVG